MSLPENGPSNTGATTQWNMLQRSKQQHNYIMMIYSQKMSLLLQTNANDSLTMKYFNTDNYVAPAPNIMSLLARTTTTQPHLYNYNYMITNLPNIPLIQHHTKPSLLSNASLSNAKSCDTSETTKPKFPPVPICPEIGSLIILEATSNYTTDHPCIFHKVQTLPYLEPYKYVVTCYGNQMKHQLLYRENKTDEQGTIE